MPFMTVAGPVPLVADFVDEAKTLSKTDFTGRHGAAFLLVPPQRAADLETRPAARTVHAVEDGGKKALLHVVSMLAVPMAKGLSTPVRLRLGRALNNDVVLSFSSVSKVHAILRHNQPGEPWSVEDAGSTNGTEVNGRRVGAGERRPLRHGDAVAFGDVRGTFSTADNFYDLLHDVVARLTQNRPKGA